MRAELLDITVRFNFLGDASPSAFHYASKVLSDKYSITVKTWDKYQYMNMHSIKANAIIMYQRNSIMQRVYYKSFFFGIRRRYRENSYFKRKYYLDAVVYQDGSVVLENF